MGVVGLVRFGLAVLAAASLLVAGCSGGADDANVVTTDAVAAALAGTVEAPVYRVTTTASMTFDFPALGTNSVGASEGVEPTLVVTVSPDRVHYVANIGLPQEVQIPGDDSIELQVWSDGERLVMDLRDFERLLGAASGVDFGPVAPGVFFIDGASIGADDPELLEVLVGISTPPLSELARDLPAALDTIEQTSENPRTYVGSTTGASLAQARGADIEAAARSAAAGLSVLLSVSVDEMTELVVEAFEASEVEVLIEIDDQGLLRVLSTREDLSGLFGMLLDAEGLFAEMTDQERQEARAELAGAEFTVETHSGYETAPDLEVPLPPEATEDRTAQWRDFLITAGFDS